MSEDRSAAEVFSQLAFELHDAEGVAETVEAVVQFALQAVWCTHAAVALVSRGQRPQIVASTDPTIAEVYRVQIAEGSGPLLTAIERGSALLIPDVAAETRWPPRWAEQVLAAGIRSAVHLPLVGASAPQAVLSLYSVKPEGFSDDDVAVAHILARHASIAIATARNEENLAHAVDARKLVGQAMGILMERHDLTSDQSFEVLKRISQDSNRKLAVVARELVESRKLPR